ncbi:MAG: PLP-dependent aminotransferase family protein [Micromonosporaceae bacterium]
MEDSWAASGGDLHIELSGTRVRAALEQALRDAVRTGRLMPGTGLPSSRSLARDLGVARNTVADAYGQLVAEGWLTARQGSGTRVAGNVARLGAEQDSAPLASDGPRVAYDLRPGTPDMSAFPRGAWLSAARRAMTAAPSEAFGYPDPRGRPELRRALAAYLARARGVRATPGRVLVCSGYAQGLWLLCAALRSTGATTLAVESLSLDHHRDIIGAAGLRTLPVMVDEAGARIGELETSAAGAVLLTPAHQFPTGSLLAPPRRAAAVEWARRTGGLVIEDDYDGEFRYDRQPVGALQGLDPDHVVYAGTASKSLAPGLRLAWMVLPQCLVEPVATVTSDLRWRTSVFDQLTLAEFIESGDYDRQVRRSRLRYRRRRDRLASALAGVAPGSTVPEDAASHRAASAERAPLVRVRGIAAGLHAVVELPGLDAGTEEAVIARAADQGLAVDGLSRYRYVPDDRAPAALVIGYGTPPDHAFSGALGALCDLIRQVRSRLG